MSSSSASPTYKIERAHQMYRDGRYEEALVFYTHALSLARTKAQKIALHSNRAACYLKLHDFKKAAAECTSVLELDHEHTGALMLRAQTLVTLKEYHSAFFDVTRLLELNPSSEVYQNLEARLKTQLSLAPIPEIEEELEEEEEDKDRSEINEDIKNTSQKEESATSILRIDKVLKLCNGGTRPAKITQVHTEESTELRKNGAFYQEKDTMTDNVSGEQRKDSSEQSSKGWQSIPKPKGHSALDYARWNSVEDDSSEEEDDDEESQPQYRFRVRTIGVRPVK